MSHHDLLLIQLAFYWAVAPFRLVFGYFSREGGWRKPSRFLFVLAILAIALFVGLLSDDFWTGTMVMFGFELGIIYIVVLAALAVTKWADGFVEVNEHDPISREPVPRDR